MNRTRYQRELISHLRIQNVFSDEILTAASLILESTLIGIRIKKNPKELATIMKNVIQDAEKE